ncbi:hypothetical protein [Blattabacterium cuenoti]|nr:hypothetical protein [Blattabacterium cuenoti]
MLKKDRKNIHQKPDIVISKKNKNPKNLIIIEEISSNFIILL